MECSRRLSSQRMSAVAENESGSPCSNKSKFARGLLDGLAAFSSKRASASGSRRSSCVDHSFDSKVLSSPSFDNSKNGKESQVNHKRTPKINLTKPSKWGKIMNSSQSVNKSPSRPDTKVHPMGSPTIATSPIVANIPSKNVSNAKLSRNAYTNNGFRNAIDQTPSLEIPSDGCLPLNFTVPELRLDNQAVSFINKDLPPESLVAKQSFKCYFKFILI